MLERLKRRFLWQPQPDEFVAPLRIEKAFNPRIERFSKGIDNTHIDISLSPKFLQHTQLLIRQELVNYIADPHWNGSRSASYRSDMQVVREAYMGMMEVAVDLVRKSSRLGVIPLLQFGVIKFLHNSVTDEIERLRAQMQRSRETSRPQSSGRAVEIHERLVVLSKEEPGLRYRIVRNIMGEILKLEENRLSKLRESALQYAWPVPRRMLFNAVSQIPSLRSDEQVMNNYTLAFTDQEAPDVFDQVNRLVLSAFREFLPTIVWPSRISSFAGGTAEQLGVTAASRQHRDPEVLAGFYEVKGLLEASLLPEEFERGYLTWLDFPENMASFIDSVQFRGIARTDSQDVAGQASWHQERWPEFHGRIMRGIFRAIRKNRLEQKIIASYAAPALFRELGGRIPVRWICQYLAGDVSRRVMVRRLRGMFPVTGVEGVLKSLDRALAGVRDLPRAQRYRQILQFLIDFTAFRSDLKLAYQAHEIMNGIRILTRPGDMDLSRGNGTLNEFVLREEQQPERHRIRSHVVLKADVRGSTSIIRELRNQKLNPASHFSLNFFEPINKLLGDFGAKKIFVEGDAVILSLFEYEDAPYQWLCVSLACGLAGKILQVVDARNTVSRDNGLPELELGLGIAFSDEAPTFLYDEEREIMISPAINRADQLSSCSALLRKSDFGKALGQGVEVVAASGLPVLEKENSDKMMRYNVNGIELDTPAFIKLQSELALNVVGLQTEIFPGGSRFYAAKYPDMRGKMHWLVVREAPVRVWSGGKPGAGQQYGHRFYQVVTQADVLTQVVGMLSRQAEDSAKGDGRRHRGSREPAGEKNYLH